MSAPKAKPWAWIAIVSVAINLFLAGMLVTQFVRRPPRGEMGPISMRGLAAAVDPSARPVVERVRDEHRDRIVAKMREAGMARRNAMDALTAEDFDEAKARAAFDAFQQKSDEAQKEMHGSLIELAKALPPDQRAKMREALRHGHRGRFGGPPRGRDSSMGPRPMPFDEGESADPTPPPPPPGSGTTAPATSP